ncbi:transposase [Enterococcus plantarum]|nr:transposase [Enterococcus plantarum]
MTRAKSVPETFLIDYSGYLHCDGYAVYETLTDITPAFCLAHVRRKFHEIATHSAYAKSCLSLCNEAFKMERELQRYEPEKRLEKRHTFLRPVYEELWDRLTSLSPLIKRAFKPAVTYALKGKKA